MRILPPLCFRTRELVSKPSSDFPRAILSNGSPKMLEAAVRHNGLESCFSSIISVDQLKTYKPSPRVYQLGPEALHLPAKEILFVSSNAWDAAGAKAFGYSVCWCNRFRPANGAPGIRARHRSFRASISFPTEPVRYNKTASLSP